MLPEEPVYRSPATVPMLRVFGVACLVASAGVAYAAVECASFVPLVASAYGALAALLALLPAAAGFVAFGLASVADSAARTAWELRIRRTDARARPGAGQSR